MSTNQIVKIKDKNKRFTNSDIPNNNKSYKNNRCTVHFRRISSNRKQTTHFIGLQRKVEDFDIIFKRCRE